MELYARNVNVALAKGLLVLQNVGISSPSRNGDVIVSPEPVMTTYARPCERVLFSPLRDANPFFHLMEAIWMLAGRNDIKFPSFFNKNFAAYSDDGIADRGAYGYRWRSWFGYDQLPVIIDELKRDRASRRVVLAMWDGGYRCYLEAEASNTTSEIPYGAGDLLASTKDKPCNTHIYFDCQQDRLNMTVCCRSNDIWWGAYGANAVHMSALLEYIAFAVGLPVGVYRQFSNNFHIYTNVVAQDRFVSLAEDAGANDRYSSAHLKPFSLISTTWEDWHVDLKNFMNEPVSAKFTDPFFRRVAAPMYRAWLTRNEKRGNGLAEVSEIVAEDWRIACTEWIERRESRKA